MDRRIDLTTNMDFRRRRVDPSVPRSIFKRESNVINRIIRPISTMLTNGTNIGTGWITFDNSSTTNFITTNSINNINTFNSFNNSYNYENVDNGMCDCCGKDRGRLPWYIDIYFLLCKECSIRMDNKANKVPWK